ncbi:MAG: SapC family protein [Pseudohongiella sp.]|nr:SapC family protein [Pseudohongiella sp.]
MNSWIAVSRSEHATKHWRPRAGYEFAAAQQVVPVLVAELAKLVPHYALGFMLDEDETCQFVALLGLGGSRNLFVTHDHQWLCSYVPATLRAFPFALHNDSDGNKVFCISEAHLSDDINQPPLFNDAGELDKLSADSLNFITQCEQSRQMTIQACAALKGAGVIEPWPISINREGQEPLVINGLFRISETALSNLDADTFASLRTAGALAIAYAQILSMAQLEQLTQRAEYLAKAQKPVNPVDALGGLFGDEDAGTLNFDSLQDD